MCLFLALALALFPASYGQTYTLVKEYAGPDLQVTFSRLGHIFTESSLNGFTYNVNITGPYDYMHSYDYGNVYFLGQADAVSESKNITYVDLNNHVIIKVDNTTVDVHAGQPDDNFGRNSIYLTSNDEIYIGSLLIFDANHIPFGCSVWSGFLTQGKIWPQQGEINIIENVNLATSNQYALYAGQAPCSQPSTVNQTGRTISANCTAPPVGCTVIESQPEAFGQVFANNNGGVYAMLLNDDGISMWFFTRQSIPSDISATGNNPNPSSWGIPSAFYPASGCDPTVVFGPQIITLYIAICGTLAGAPGVFTQTCGNVAPNCISLVADPHNYDNAYWDINYIRVFSAGSNTSNPSSSNSSLPPSPTSPSGEGGNNTASSGSSGGGSSAQSILSITPTAVIRLVISLALATTTLL